MQPTDLELDQLLASRRPHDDLAFTALATRYNFQLTSDRRRTFARLVIEECETRSKPVRVLDVGCGRGIGRQTPYTWAIRRAVDDFWGIEPDSEVEPDAGLFDHFEHATLESATLPQGAFDLVYAYMVMEHVEEPAGFLKRVYECLKPGGVFLFMTPNGRHYFTRLARSFHRLRLEELMLRMVKGSRVGYHYPVQYKFNHRRAIERLARDVGFAQPEFAFIESEGPAGYLPGPLKPILWAMNLKRRMFRNPENLLTLTGRFERTPT